MELQRRQSAASGDRLGETIPLHRLKNVPLETVFAGHAIIARRAGTIGDKVYLTAKCRLAHKPCTALQLSFMQEDRPR